MVLYNVPKEYGHISNAFTVEINGISVPVLSCRVSAYPFNRPWPGHQRDINQTEEGAYVRFGSDNEFTLNIKPKHSYNKVVIRPLSKGITPVINEDGSVTATFPGKGQYTIEFDDTHHAVAVFADPEKEFDVNKDDPDTLYFGPGVHEFNSGITLKDNQTVYIDKDAVLYGGFIAENAKNIRIVGYGILDNSKCDILPVRLNNCSNITVDGLTIIDTCTWTLVFRGGENFDVKNVKLYGFWRYNADGCDFCNVRNASIKDSFIRSFDDCIVVKGLKSAEEQPVDGILAENCVLWCDWGRALEIGAENCAPYIRNITFKNIDIIHGMDVMLDVQQGDRADIENVLYEDIRAEYSAVAQAPMIQKGEEDVYINRNPDWTPFLIILCIRQNSYSHDATTGSLRGFTFRNIYVTTEDGRLPLSDIGTNVEGSVIENLTFENIVFDGKRAETAKDAGIRLYTCNNAIFEGKKIK